MRSILRLAAAVGWLAVAACSFGSTATIGDGASAARASTSPDTAAASQAADLRTHLDLLLAEHVMLVAKETVAAVNRSDAYPSYIALLSSNLADLTELMRSAFGNTAASDFSAAWSMQNAYLVDYGIGAVTHNDGKAASAMSALRDKFAPAFVSDITNVSGLPSDPLSQLTADQILADKAFIDDAAAAAYTRFYTDLATAYFGTQRLGDALAGNIAQRFPDKFPGDPGIPAVDRRVALNLLLQQHAFLATMATDALVAGRDADRAAVTVALGTNGDTIGRSLAAGDGFRTVWAARTAAVLGYAQSGDGAAMHTLMATGPPFARAAHAPPAAVNLELSALVKVIDDQRAKEFQSIATDDRAAATSMQPVADAISAAV